VRGEIPFHAGHTEVPRQHFLDVGVADTARPLQKSFVTRHGDEADQRLQVIAVEFGIRRWKEAKARLHGSLCHGVGDHVHHAVEPRRPPEILGDGYQPVFRVFTGAEETRRAELTR
jgi:hypothetical protein